MLSTDLSTAVPEVKLPVYLLHGRFDYTCSYREAKSYFDKLKAPVKGFYTFERSAHSPMFEEPERTRLILREDVLARKRRARRPVGRTFLLQGRGEWKLTLTFLSQVSPS